MTTFFAAGVEDGSCFWDGLPGFRAAPGKQIKKRPRRRGQRPRRGGRAAEMRSPPQANAGKQSQKVLGMTGWTLIPDVTKPCALTITGAGSGTLTVAGDATGLCASGDVFRIVPPAGVSVSSGALAAAQSAGLNTFDDPGCMWLWSGYRYIPPQVGHDIGGTTYGAQPGGNKLGQYYCHHRVYDILTARWTSPDPAASPWTNLQDYCGNNPVQLRDPSGLMDVDIDDYACTITLTYYVQYVFDAALRKSEDEMRAWAADSNNAIMKQWSDKFTLQGKRGYYVTEDNWICDDRTYWVPCPCPNGYAAKLKVLSEIHNISGAWWGDDVEVHVGPGGGADTSGDVISVGDKGNQELTRSTHGGEALGTQTDIAHEFGHFLGFDHPGGGGMATPVTSEYKDGSKPAGGAGGNTITPDYNDPVTQKPSSDIMGVGSDMDLKYAELWLKHLRDHNEECGPYTASKK